MEVTIAANFVIRGDQLLSLSFILSACVLMFAYLKGIVRDTSISKQCRVITVVAGGVGYEVFTPTNLNVRVGEEGEFNIYTSVREDRIELFGFAELYDKRIFKILVSVKGVGNRLALAIMGQIGSHSLVRAIANKDAEELSKIKGVGAKTALRVVVDTAEKFAEIVQEICGEFPIAKDKSLQKSQSNNGRRDLVAEIIGAEQVSAEVDLGIQALLSLGFDESTAERAVRTAVATIGEVDVSTLVKEALKHL